PPRLLLAYDGSQFHGFAENRGVRTVAGALREALSLVCRRDVDITGAGRTDAGVHAWGQVVSCDLPPDTDLENLPRRLTKLCAPGIVVRSAEWTDPDFDARFSARWRHYRYVVVNDPVTDPFIAGTSWQVSEPLDLALMRLACDPLIGEHDFSAFCRRPAHRSDQEPVSLRRRVLTAHWSERVSDTGQRLLVFEIRAQAFCHQMVRSIVGTVVDAGLRRLTPGEITGILLSRDRSRAGQVAPPQGLTLWEVGYGPEQVQN
ncbi:MAG: tRNA pseudouridine(38-40) synthase TruA, partial [Ilumatobacteraceae bacterium]